ncbi:MAG: hypothetical protein HXS44_03205, partial [Theionarchaea archaeon]|nr:hypothetical protein [Theionarchaea archaeon]
MSEGDVAVIADRETGLAFRSMGLQALYAEPGKVGEVLVEASKKYKII